MFANKIFPSFFMLSLEGDATKFLLSENYNIEFITIGSTEFSSDLEAITNVETLTSSILSTINFNNCEKDVEKNIKLNPEFFPNAEPLQISEEKQIEVEELALLISSGIQKYSGENDVSPSQIITNYFDEMGDFVQSKTVISNDKFKITHKIFIEPHLYLLEKNKNFYLKQNSIIKNEYDNNFHIH